MEGSDEMVDFKVPPKPGPEALRHEELCPMCILHRKKYGNLKGTICMRDDGEYAYMSPHMLFVSGIDVVGLLRSLQQRVLELEAKSPTK